MKGSCPSEVVIKDGTLSIAYYAFSGCKGLTSVTIPDSVTSIGSGAFSGCKGLTSVTIGNSVTSIGWYAFYGCTGLTSIEIPDSVTSIGNSAFDCCTGLTSVTIGNSVTSIGYLAFYRCTGLTSIDIPDSVTSIGSSAFYDTAWYNNQPDGLVYAGKVAYKMKGTCPSEVVIKDGTLGIAGSAFYDCTGLTSVTIPDSVTSIGSGAFYNTAWYNNQPDGLVYAGKVAYKMKGDCPSEIVIKDGTLGIVGGAFFGCTGLTSINIPDSVTSIGGEAFYGCTGLTSVTIPDSVTSISSSAFGYYDVSADRFHIKIDDFTIYGFEGSEAEKYAKDNEFTFVPLKSKADEATGIILDIPEDTELTIKDITAEIISSMPAENSKMTAYDISLTKDGETVQPENIVTVKIPCTNETAKVYRFEADGTMTDMNAKYVDGYMVFTTDHFSVYVMAEPKSEDDTVSGDVTGDGKTNVQDCTAILRYVRKLDTLDDEQLKRADVTGDGKVNVQDVTRILRAVRKLEELY